MKTEFMKASQRTTISLYGTVYNKLFQYKKKKEHETGLRLNFQQAISMLLNEISSAQKKNIEPEHE